MKKLFFLLLVVNLVIWLWGQRDRLARVTETAPPGLGEIRLLDDAEVAARRQQALTQAAVPEPSATDVPADAGGEPRLPVAARIAAVEPELAAADTGAPPITDDTPPASVAAHRAAAAAPEVPAEAAEATGGDVAARVADAAVAAPGEAPSSAVLVAAPGAVGPAADAVAASAAVPAVADSSPQTERPALPVGEAAPPAPEPMATTAPAVELEQIPGPVAAAAGDAGREAVGVDTSATTAAEPPSAGPPAAEASAAAGTAAAEPAAPVAAARDVQYLCESIGPFADRAAAVRFRDGIAGPLRAATLREERAYRAVRHWVLAPVQPSKEALTAYLASLEQAGVGDTWRIPSGPLAGRLSLGVFRSAENARKHADMLAAKGVATEIHSPTDTERDRVYWVDYERPADAAPPDPGAVRTEPARQVVPRSCGRVAGP